MPHIYQVCQSVKYDGRLLNEDGTVDQPFSFEKKVCGNTYSMHFQSRMALYSFNLRFIRALQERPNSYSSRKFECLNASPVGNFPIHTVEMYHGPLDDFLIDHISFFKDRRERYNILVAAACVFLDILLET